MESMEKHGKGRQSNEWKGVLIANLSGFERGEGKDTAMASARRLGVILLPREAGDEEHGLHPPLLGRGGLFSSSRGSSPLVAASYIQKEEGREVTVASPFSSGEKRSTPPLLLYTLWRASHLTFS